jgi:hypothetical protein
VAKIVDLLGASKQFPQHHGIPGSDALSWDTTLED